MAGGYYNASKVAAVCLSNTRMHNFSIFATSKAGTSVSVMSKLGDPSCYTSRDAYYGYGAEIILGHDFYSNLFPANAKIYPVELKEKYKHMATIYLGAFYHEFFHVMYTDFKVSSTTLRRLDEPFRSFAARVSNTLEDITIEGSGRFYFPYCAPYLDELGKHFDTEENIESLSKAVVNAPREASTLLQYLLLYVRGVSGLPKYDLWDKNIEFIKWGAHTCINTISPVTRFKRQVNYALQLAKILNLKAPDKNEVTENVSESDINSEASSLSGLGSSNSPTGTPMDQLGNLSKNSSIVQNKPQDSKGDLVDEDMKPIARTSQASRDNPYDNEASGINQTDLAREGIGQLANDDPVSRWTHKADRLDRHFNTQTYAPQYLSVVKKHERQIREVVAIIRKMLSHNNTSWNRYKMSGQFDVSTVSKKDNYKFFKKKNAPSQEADLVFEILVDNSGSMSGSKSRLAGEALIIFCEALNRLHIPFAVDAFTEGRSCVTIKLKEFSDTYDKTKTNMTLLTEQHHVSELNTFRGNIDEVNLMFVRDILKRQKQADKVCIVISDGATCGSWHDLRKVAQGMEKDGITVLGVGIYDTNVEKIYDKHIVLRNSSDLEGLGGFLNKYLIKKIFKGGE